MQPRFSIQIVAVISLCLTVLAALMAATDCADWNSSKYFQVAGVEHVAACLASGADPNARDGRHGETPLHGAAEFNKNPAVIAALLDSGADIEAQDGIGQTPLLRAFFRAGQNSAIITALLDAGADPNSRNNSVYGREITPLHLATIFDGNLAFITVLLAAGADIEARDKFGETPLHWAARKTYRIPVIAALLDAGANLGARDEGSRTPLHWALGSGFQAPDVVTALLDAGADPNARDGNGETPLHWAAAHSKEPADLTALLVAGADPKLRNADGKTPWDLAPENSDAYWLLGDPKARDERGATPLHYSVGGKYSRYRNPAIIAVLLDAGADINARTEDGETPLHLATIFDGNLAFITEMLDAGADPNARDLFGSTPLHKAAGSGYQALDVITALLDAGADPNARSNAPFIDRDDGGIGFENMGLCHSIGALKPLSLAKDDTPLHRAAQCNKNPAVIAVLLDAGADPKARNAAGKTPWDYAKDNEALKSSAAYWRLNDARF